MDPTKRLSNIISASLQENSLNKLTEYLASLENSNELLNADLILVLIQVLKKNGKYERKKLHVSCVLDCLQHFLGTVQDAQKWEKVSEDLSKLCELVFVISSYIKDESLIQRTTSVISTAVDDAKSVTDDLLRFMMKTLLVHSLCKTYNKHTRLQIMILIGSILQHSSRAIRTEILPSTIDHLKDLPNTLTECEDYETQVSVVEILARCLTFIPEKYQQSLFISNPKIGEMYREFQPFLNFDPDCRQFLNKVNESLGDQQQVFSVPCMVVSADDNRLRKPTDPAYTDFWVDFNLKSRSISFYYQPNSEENWELVTVPEEKVLGAVAKDSACQSKRGVKFEAVKFELTIDSSDLSPNTELPQILKIYPTKDKYIKIEHVIKAIFGEKYKTEVLHNEKQKQGMVNKSPEEVEEKSFLQMSTLSKVPENKDEDDKATLKSNTQSNESSGEESGEEVSVGDSPFLKLIKGKMLEDKKQLVLNESSKIKVNEAKSVDRKTNFNNKLEQLQQKQSPFQENKSCGSGCNASRNILSSSIKDSKHLSPKSLAIGSEESKNTNLCTDINYFKTPNYKDRDIHDESNAKSKKKRLYSFEESNAEDVVMSSQDQEPSIQIPSYKIPKKETHIKPKSNMNRKNISYSYIKNKGKSTTHTKDDVQKQFNFEDDLKSQLSDDNLSESANNSSSDALFKDLTIKPKSSPTNQPKNNKFFSNHSNKDSQKIRSNNCKSVYSDFSESERKDPKKYNKTYNRSKPKKPWKRLKAIPLVSSESSNSDSDTNYVPPAKQLKEDKEMNRNSPFKTRFAHRVVNDKVDPTRDILWTNEIELNITNDFVDHKIKPRQILAEPLMTDGKDSSKISVRVAQCKNKKPRKNQATKHACGKSKKNLKPTDPKEDILEKMSHSLTDCMDVAKYESPEACSTQLCEDLALDILSCNDDQQKALLLRTTFKANDMVRFGRLLIKQVQEKISIAERLAHKERDMNFATFDYKLQASCSELYGKSQNMEAVTDKLEKLSTMIQTTFKLHKDIAAQINSELLKIEEAKSDLLKNSNKIKKAESSSISSVFQGFGGFLKKLVLSFIQGNPTKIAITDKKQNKEN